VRQEASHPDTSRFAEDEAEIVRRHVDDFGKSKSGASGDLPKLIHVANAPLRIVRAQIGIKLFIAGRGMAAATAIWPV